MKAFPILTALVLAGCASSGPDYSAAICLERDDQFDKLERDLVGFFQAQELEVSITSKEYPLSGDGRSSHVFVAHGEKWWGVYASVRNLASLREGGDEHYVWATAREGWDADILEQYRTLLEEEWGGTPVPNSGISGDECDEGFAARDTL